MLASINEFLFEPALPIYTIDKPERYPHDKNLARELVGLKRRLEQDDSKYVEDSFSEDYESAEIGQMKVACYVFRSKVEGKSVKESRETIEREFFKNNMSVLFSVNGQVHGHYTSEFITRSLKMPLLKSHLLIHVDCTHMRMTFRNELFMASRDRLKGADETRMLRDLLTDLLSRGKLQQIYRQRKDSISLEPGDAKDTSELLRAFTKSMPLNSELFKLLSNTFKLDIPRDSTAPPDTRTAPSAAASRTGSGSPALGTRPDSPSANNPIFRPACLARFDLRTTLDPPPSAVLLRPSSAVALLRRMERTGQPTTLNPLRFLCFLGVKIPLPPRSANSHLKPH